MPACRVCAILDSTQHPFARARALPMQLTTFLEIYFATFFFWYNFLPAPLRCANPVPPLPGSFAREKKNTYQTPGADQLPTPSSALALVQVVGGGAVTAIVTVATPAFSLVLQSFGSIPHLAPPAACTQLPSSRAVLAALENQSDLIIFIVSPKKTSRFARRLCRASQTPVERPTYKCSTSLDSTLPPRVSAPAVLLVLEQLHTVLRLIESHFGRANVQQQQPVRCCRRFVPNKSHCDTTCSTNRNRGSSRPTQTNLARLIWIYTLFRHTSRHYTSTQLISR